MAGQLQDKVAIVTGSNSGIGEAIAVMFASRGAKVTLCGRDQERLKSVLEKVVKISGGHRDKFITVQGNLDDARIRKEIVDKTIEAFGRLDILVPNAGISSFHQTVQTVTEESFDKHTETNLKSVLFLIQEALPYLEKSQGSIVSISSNLTSAVLTALTVYSINKAGLDQMTRSLAVDLGPKGIRVNSVNPGYILTNIGRDFRATEDINVAKKQEPVLNDRQPLRGRTLTVEDVAEAVSFLASDAASCITGELIKVDCGRSYGGSLTEVGV